MEIEELDQDAVDEIGRLDGKVARLQAENAKLKTENRELISAMPECCWRKCRDCGGIHIHREAWTPGVLCRVCGSQDTRLLKKETEALKE